MDAIALQEKIAGDDDSIYKVVESLGYENIKEHKNYFTFPRLDGDNQSANVIYIDSLKWTCFTRNQQGNLFTLVMDTKDCTFPKALEYIGKVLGIKDSLKTKVKPPFNGFYKNLLKDHYTEDDDKVYKESILQQYDGLSQKFFQDGVSFEVQQKFEIGYSHEDDAIAIPIRNIKGQLIGVKMRNNDPNCDMSHRFWTSYPYCKTGVVYGLYQNYQKIIQKNTIIICESEKATLQATSLGCFLVAGVGGHNISTTQARLIKSLMVDRIIVAYDEGISEDNIVADCEKLKMKNSFYCPKIQYVYDKNHEVLKLGSKDSPVDHGEKVFKALLKNCIYTI